MAVVSNPAVRQVAVIGGGRWARVIGETLAGLMPAEAGISIHTARNVDVTESWLRQRGLAGRISVAPARPEPRAGMAVIVANAARDHFEAIGWALRHRLPVLSEKPVTLKADDTAALIAEARALQTLLCAGHVLLFAGYVERFAAMMRPLAAPLSVEMQWTDPQGESRYGEAKSYDAGIPVHADCLPHVLSLLWGLLPEGRTEVLNVNVTRGGAREDLRLGVDGVPADVRLERNSDLRRRLIAIVNKRGRWVLDFSTEPGVVSGPDGASSADPDWRSSGRPMARMLAAFLRAATGEPADPRLSIDLGHRANRIIDTVAAEYERQLLPWAAERMRLSGAAVADPDLRYRLAERLQEHERLSPERLDAEIARCLATGARSPAPLRQ